MANLTVEKFIKIIWSIRGIKCPLKMSSIGPFELRKRVKAEKANELFSKANLVEKKVKSNKNNVQVKKIKLQVQPDEQCPKP